MNVGVLFRDRRAPLRFVQHVDEVLAQLELEIDATGADASLSKG